MVKSIQRDGQQAPVIITPEGEIIDGNRRTAACGVLGIKVWCVVSEGNKVNTYRILNSSDTQKPIRGNAILNVYLLNPEAIQQRTRKSLDVIFATLGLSGFRQFYNDGGNLSTWSESRLLSDYIVFSDIGLIALWMAKHRQSLRSRIARKTRLNPSLILARIKADKPISDDDNYVAGGSVAASQPKDGHLFEGIE